MSSSRLDSTAVDCIFENVTTLWLKRPTLQITSIPLPQRVPFSCQQSFCWNRHPIFKRRIAHCEMKLFRGKICFLLWLHLNVKQLPQLSDYRFPPVRRLHRSSFPLRFLHLGTKIKSKTCTWKMSYSWTGFIYIAHTLMFNTCFHANEYHRCEDKAVNTEWHGEKFD